MDNFLLYYNDLIFINHMYLELYALLSWQAQGSKLFKSSQESALNVRRYIFYTSCRVYDKLLATINMKWRLFIL